MKQLTTLLVLLWLAIGTSMQAGEIEAIVSPSNLTSKKIIQKSADEKSGRITFEIEVPTAGNYFLNFWQCAAIKSNGDLQDYTVSVNGTRYSKTLSPEATGWCAAKYPEKISLQKGKNLVSFSSDLPCIPNIELIEVGKYEEIGKSEMLKSTAFRDYISEIKSKTQRTATASAFGDAVIRPGTDTLNTARPIVENVNLYDFSHYDVPWFGYTFYTTVYLKEGDTLNINSSGVNNVKHVIEVFHAETPEKFSWANLSDDNGELNISRSITKTGTYYVRARTYYNCTQGFCNISINDLMSYESVPICSVGFTTNFTKEDTEYNVFTANSQSDPMLFLTTGIGLAKKICAYNNDYASTGDYNWGKNARIRQQFSKSSINVIFISSAGAYNPKGSCKIFAGCKKSPIMPYFENLKEDDAIASSPATNDYNCISWTGGIVTYWEWPPSPFSEYSVGEDLASFDLFYSSNRYPGCTKYTRGSNLSGTVGVDLWGFRENGIEELTHGSISINSDGNWHGYAWESKPGSLTRTFHPRDALRGGGYGTILYHYNVSSGTPSYSLEESIADNKAVMEDVLLTDAQESLISEKISQINVNILALFNSYYTAWESVWEASPLSNPDAIKDCSQYRNLVGYSKSNSLLKYVVYDKVKRGVQSAIPMFEDLFLTDNTTNRQKLSRIKLSNSNSPYDNMGRKIVRTISSNQKLLLKSILADEVAASSLSEDESAEQRKLNDFGVSSNGLNLVVALDLASEADVTIDVVDMNQTSVRIIERSEGLNCGLHNYSIVLPQEGTYLVRCIVNGNLLVKKIMVK